MNAGSTPAQEHAAYSTAGAAGAAGAPMYDSVTSSPGWMSRNARITAAVQHELGQRKDTEACLGAALASRHPPLPSTSSSRLNAWALGTQLWLQQLQGRGGHGRVLL